MAFSMEVSNAQRLLNSFGHNLVVDGILGPKTTEAVKAYQRQHGIDPNGIVSAQLISHMTNKLNSTPSTSSSTSVVTMFKNNKKAVIISFSALTLIGGFFFIKKRLGK